MLQRWRRRADEMFPSETYWFNPNWRQMPIEVFQHPVKTFLRFLLISTSSTGHRDTFPEIVLTNFLVSNSKKCHSVSMEQLVSGSTRHGESSNLAFILDCSAPMDVGSHLRSAERLGAEPMTPIKAESESEGHFLYIVHARAQAFLGFSTSGFKFCPDISQLKCESGSFKVPQSRLFIA